MAKKGNRNTSAANFGTPIERLQALRARQVFTQFEIIFTLI